jgi:putative sterol carrier protein
VTPEEDRYQEFIDIANIIIEHHNNYRSDVLVTANYQDFMSLIPTHFTAMINGYLTGIENEKNRNSVRVYKHILSEEAYNYIDKIQDIKIEKDI